MDIGNNIKKIRELRNYTQEFMADALEISQRHYSRIENNQTDLTRSKLKLIGDILGVNFTQILGFDEKYLFHNCGTAFGNNQNYYAFSEREITHYEKRIEQLESEVVFLRNYLEHLQK